MFRLTLFAFCAFLCSAAHSAELLDGLSIEQVFADSNCKINSRRINPLSMGVDHELTLAGKRLFLSIGVYEHTEKAEEKFKRVIRTISTSGESVEIGDGGFVWPGSGTTRFRLKNVCITIGAKTDALAAKTAKHIEAFINEKGHWTKDITAPTFAIALPKEVSRGRKVKMEIGGADDDPSQFLFYLPGLDTIIAMPARTSLTFTAPDKPGKMKTPLLIASPRNLIVLKEVSLTIAD